jgi:hypothetical protein
MESSNSGDSQTVTTTGGYLVQLDDNAPHTSVGVEQHATILDGSTGISNIPSSCHVDPNGPNVAATSQDILGRPSFEPTSDESLPDKELDKRMLLEFYSDEEVARALGQNTPVESDSLLLAHIPNASEGGPPCSATPKSVQISKNLPMQDLVPFVEKRKSKKRPQIVVDDEIPRSTRRHQQQRFVHMELDQKTKPRKLMKDDTEKLKKKLDSVMAEEAIEDFQPVPIVVLQAIAVQFCEVAPEEVTSEKLLSRGPNEDKPEE